jgi:regulator of replication initiation timing
MASTLYRTKTGLEAPGNKCLNYTFMRLYKDTKRLCGCQKETCIAIGYCGEGSFQLPSGQKPGKANLRKQWCQALGIDQKEILAGETILRIAYWHFPERFRHFDEKAGAWKLKPTDKWVDNERKEWLGAVPIRNLDDFVITYLSARHKPTFRLPAAVSTVQKPRQITVSPSSTRRVLYAPNSTAFIELESAYKVVNMELVVANKSLLDSQKENSSLKQELDALKQELKNTKFRLEKVEKERAASRHELEQHVEKITALRTRLVEGVALC